MKEQGDRQVRHFRKYVTAVADGSHEQRWDVAQPRSGQCAHNLLDFAQPEAAGLPQGSIYIYEIPTSFVVEPACATVTSPQSEV